MIREEQPYYQGASVIVQRLGVWIAGRKRALLRVLTLEVKANRKTKNRPVKERAEALLALALGFTSVFFIGYLGAFVSVSKDAAIVRDALSSAVWYSFFCTAALLGVDYQRRVYTNLSVGTHRFYVYVAQAALVVELLVTVNVVTSLSISVDPEDHRSNPKIAAGLDRLKCNGDRLEKVEGAAKRIKEANKAVSQCEHQLDSHTFAVRLGLERGDFTAEKAQELRKLARKLCDPYLDDYEAGRLEMELVFARKCEPATVSAVD